MTAGPNPRFERLWHAAVREGHVLGREVIEERARQHVASVNEFLSATRGYLAIWDVEMADQN